MKRLILILMGASFIFFSCSKDDSFAPLHQNDQKTYLKKAKVKRTFEGICTFAFNEDPLINEWYDATNDWRTTGTTIWVINEDVPFGGTATLYVDAKNPHHINRGKWDMIWSGTITPTNEGLVLVATANGIGVEGKVKGMIGHWTYTMNYVGSDFPNPENSTFFYTIKGNIDKPKCHINE